MRLLSEVDLRVVGLRAWGDFLFYMGQDCLIFWFWGTHCGWGIWLLSLCGPGTDPAFFSEALPTRDALIVPVRC